MKRLSSLILLFLLLFSVDSFGEHNNCKALIVQTEKLAAQVLRKQNIENWRPKSALELYATLVGIAQKVVQEKDENKRTSYFNHLQSAMSFAIGSLADKFPGEFYELYKRAFNKRFSIQDPKVDFTGSWIPALESHDIKYLRTFLTPEVLSVFFKIEDIGGYFHLMTDQLLALQTIENFYKEISEGADPLEDPTGTWRGLKPTGLNTNYHDLLAALETLNLKRNSVVADMGSAAGRLGMIIGSNFKHLKYVGYEYHMHRMKPAQQTAKNLKYNNVKYINADFAAKDFKPVVADVYFIYYSNGLKPVMEKMLAKIKKVAERKQITLLVSRSLGIENEEMLVGEKGWLEGPEYLQGVPFRIYRSK